MVMVSFGNDSIHVEEFDWSNDENTVSHTLNSASANLDGTLIANGKQTVAF